MKKDLAKAVTHREFLRMCGLAIVGAGVGQMVVSPKSALAADGTFDNLTVAGSVAIGAAPNPAVKLQVGSGAVPGLGNMQLKDPTASYISAASDGSGVVIFMGSDGNPYGILGTFSNHGVGIRTGNVERVRITAAGNVGIGTDNPSQVLEVSGSNEPLIKVTHKGMTGNPFLLMGMNSGNNAAIFQASTGKDFKFYNGQYSLTILGSNGNVGIGTSAPSDRLQVAGNVRVNGELWINTSLAIDTSGVAAKCYYAP